MEIARKGSILALRLEHGEDVLASIDEAVKEERSTMFIFAGLGMVTEFELGYFDNGMYVTRSFPEPHELVSMQGSVAVHGQPRVHPHVCVASREHVAFGGHLLRGKVWMSNEIVLVRMEGQESRRIRDEAKRVGILHYEGE